MWRLLEECSAHGKGDVAYSLPDAQGFFYAWDLGKPVSQHYDIGITPGKGGRFQKIVVLCSPFTEETSEEQGLRRVFFNPPFPFVRVACRIFFMSIDAGIESPDPVGVFGE